MCRCRETVRVDSWHGPSSSRSTRVSSRKATPTSSASTCSGRSTPTTAERSTSRSFCWPSTSRRPANRSRSSSGRSRCTTSTATGPSSPRRWRKSSLYVWSLRGRWLNHTSRKWVELSGAAAPVFHLNWIASWSAFWQDMLAGCRN